MGLAQGQRIGDWIVEDPVGTEDTYRCHRVDTPFRKAFLRLVKASDATQLQQEASALAHLEHPNIQGIIGLETAEGELFLVSEAAQGTTLAAFVRQPPLPAKAALEIALQVADALRAAHARGITHRDVRPERVILTEDGRALLSSFMLRNTLDLIDVPSAYAAPETTRTSLPENVPSEVAEQRRDAYAFGVTLCELVTGKPVAPIDASSRRALSVEVEVPESVRDLVARLTHPDPEARATIGEAREALSLALRNSLGDTYNPDAAAVTYVDFAAAEEVDDRPIPGNIGRYDVLREIGRGGVGVVYEAQDPGLQRRVALKVLLAGNFARARDIERFLREARAVAQLDHPSIVRILEFDREGGSAWFAMEFVDGPTLLQHIRDDGALDWQQAVQIAAQLARALAHAHQSGLLHRDVKPNNVLLEDGVRPRLTDFGLAVSTDSGDATRLTRTGQVLGTPMYMSPEQARGDLADMGPHTDVYGVGVVLYEALTGQVPFDGPSPVAIIHQVLERDPTAPRQLVPNIPREVETICLKAMRRSPRDRYPTAQALAEDLERCLRGEPILAHPPTLLDQARWFVRRNRSAFLAAVAALLAATAVAVGGYATVQGSTIRLESERQETAAEALEATVERLAQLTTEDRVAESERVWSTFLKNPEHRGTRALVEGWLLHADQSSMDGLSATRLASLGMAYAVADSERDQERALWSLANALREERKLDHLLLVVETLQERAPALARRPEMKALHRDALAAQRRLVAAADLAEGTPLAPVLLALSQAADTPHRASQLFPWPDDEGLLALRRGSSRRISLVGRTPRLRRRGELDLDDRYRSLFPLPQTRPGRVQLLGGPRGGGATLLTESREELRTAQHLEGRTLRTVASGDVDGDGSVEHYLGLGRQLVRLSGEGSLGLDFPHPRTNEANSEINALAIADLDSDGTNELIVAAAEWGAYDVRVLGQQTGGDTLVLKDRTKLGAVSDLAVLPLPSGTATVLATKHNSFANLQVFPAESPTGAAKGLWRLRMGPGGLQQERLLNADCSDLDVGDLDGNGILDLVAACDGDILVMVQDEAGELHDLWLHRLHLLAVTNVDEDPADELIVADPRAENAVWVLGAGRGSPPVLGTSALRRQEAPNGVSAAFAATWQRAEDLAYVGRMDQAAEAMAQLAEDHWGRVGGREAKLRAADLLDTEGNYAEAAELYEQAAEGASAEEVREAQRAAARAQRAAHNHAQEFQLLRAIASSGPLEDEEARRLTKLDELASRATLNIDFNQPLAPGWQISAPLSLHRMPDGGLEFEAFGRGDLASLPVKWDGRHLELEVNLSVDRSEWAGGMEFALVDATDPERFAGIRIAGRGGGEVVERWVTCWSGGRVVSHHLPSTNTPMTVKLEVFADQTGIACGAVPDEPSWEPVRGERIAPVREGTANEWLLVLRSTGNPDTLVNGTVTRISLLGASLREASPQTMLGSARLALVDGNLALAESRLVNAGRQDLALSIALAAEHDDGLALRSALRQAMDAGEGDSAITHLLHARPDDLGSELRPLLGRKWPFYFSDAWGTTLASHASDPEVVRVLLRHLPDLENQDGRTREEVADLIVLNARRGAAAIVASRLDLAESSLSRGLDLFEQLDPRRVPGSLLNTIARIHLDRAVVSLLDGEAPSMALASIDDALQISPTPEIVADMAAARHELRSLRSLPGWQNIVEPARRGVTPMHPSAARAPR